MTLPPRLRKLVLTAHVTTTVGWLGAVIVVTALAAVALTSSDARQVRGALLVMEPIAWYVLLPLAAASLVVGIVQSLATAWGLFRHYWVLFKLLLTVAATIVLVLYMETFGRLADAAADPASSTAGLRSLAASPLLHGSLALLVLLIATVLAVYKPKALTPYGQRNRNQ